MELRSPPLNSLQSTALRLWSDDFRDSRPGLTRGLRQCSDVDDCSETAQANPCSDDTSSAKHLAANLLMIAHSRVVPHAGTCEEQGSYWESS